MRSGWRTEVQRIIRAQRKANHSKTVIALPGTFAEKHRCFRNLSLGLEVIGVESTAKRFRVRDGICHLAMIEIRGEGHETGFCQPRAKSLDRVVQSPPGMKNQYAGSLASGWDGQDNPEVECVSCGLLKIVDGLYYWLTIYCNPWH